MLFGSETHCGTGVLTKPDRVQPGESLDQWISILKGDRFELGYGYYVVKNNPDPHVDHSTARTEEAYFFRTQEPYAQTLHRFQSRFGTPNLQAALSRMQSEQIRQWLVIIRNP